MNSTISRPRVRSRLERAARCGRGRTVRPIAFLIGLLLVCNPPAARAGQGLAAPAVDRPGAAHFLETATFGPTDADVAAVQSMGPAAWLQMQLALPETPIAASTEGNAVRNQLFLNLANAPDQVRQRMIFALSQIVVVSSNKTGSGDELTPWVRLLSQHAFGNYREFLRAVTVSPTMGKYLDGAYSRKASSTSSPNENYPREMLQLFSIGLWMLNQDGTPRLNAQGQTIPAYSQDHIKELARALTGWTFPVKPGESPRSSNPQYFVGEMVPGVSSNPNNSPHDFGAKTLLNGVVLPAGQSAAADLDAVVDNVFYHPNVGPFVATRLIRSLVTSNPSPAYVARVASVFENNGGGIRGDMKAVLAAVLLDPEASAFGAEDGRLKDPILHVLGLGRALGVTFANPDGINYVFSNLTERVLSPQTVFSFFSPLGTLPGHADLFGPEFGIYPPALAVQRANFIYGLLNGQFSSSFPFALTPFLAVASSPPALVEMINQQLMFGRMSGELGLLLVTATTAVPASDTRQRALGALYLAAISSEYAVFTTSAGIAAPGVQPPTGLVATSIVGNQVTLRWNAPLIGPAPTTYVMEGGVSPGQALQSLPTGSASPTVTFMAPQGAFYVRVHSVSGAARSRASSEIRIYVNVPTGPTAPMNLLGMVKGTSLGLSWRNTFGGGAPTAMLLDVTGTMTLSMPLPVTETFTFPDVPPGTYTFSVRARNAAGSSGSSNPLTLTFPTTCSGAPQTPTNFAVARFGNVLTLGWQASVSGPAALSYQLDVTGDYLGRLPLSARSLTVPVPGGTYNVRVRAVNACGNSGFTAVQSVRVP